MKPVVGCLIAAPALAFALLFAQPAHAAKPSWDQKANIAEAATRLAQLHLRQGSQGVVKFLDACYRTHTIAERFTQGLEACLTQDYIHSQALAIIYARMPEAERTKQGMPSAEIITRMVAERMATVFQRYKIASPEADAFRKSIDLHGFPVFLKAVFPSASDAPPVTENNPAKPK
jgi:hypothetical protein